MKYILTFFCLTFFYNLAFCQSEQVETSSLHIRVGGGLTFPSGGWNSEVDMGYSAGAEFSFGRNDDLLSLVLIISYHSLPLNIPEHLSRDLIATNWDLVYMMASLKIGTKISTGAKLYAFPMLGLLIEQSPDITMGSLKLNGVNSTWFAFGFGLGFSVPDLDKDSRQKLDFGFRFILSGPNYQATNAPTGIMQLQIAFIFL
ncbi:MAG: hypothetical protein QME58_12105 [Bacteroidota bacterium]|nr:hypothetical protein [Bacteroidota bacterium]